MFYIKNRVFHVTRGDRGSFEVTFKDYTFQPGDTLELKIYWEDHMDMEPILTKTVIADATVDTLTVDLLGADTQLGEPTNERVTFWYEITLNGDQTPFCYDETGPRLFYVYPGGVD